MLPRKSDGQVKFPKLILPIRQMSDVQNTQSQLENPLTPSYQPCSQGLFPALGAPKALGMRLPQLLNRTFFAHWFYFSDNSFSRLFLCRVHDLVSGLKFILSLSDFDIVIMHIVQKLSSVMSLLFSFAKKAF